LLIEKIADRLQQRLKRTPCRSSSRSAKLICRAVARATLNSASRERRPKANSADHPATDDIGRLFGVAANHPQMRDIAPPAGKQKSACRRTLETPILP